MVTTKMKKINLQRTNNKKLEIIISPILIMYLFECSLSVFFPRFIDILFKSFKTSVSKI